MKASFIKHNLQFKRPAGTSRGTYTTKDSWYISLTEGENTGIGECSILRDLSIDDRPDFEQKLIDICDEINFSEYDFETPLTAFPAIQFGLETALLDLKNGGIRTPFPSNFTQGKTGIPTNGLIWMGDKKYMREQIAEKLDRGFSCIKLKIGALNWSTEKELITSMRSNFSEKELTIRVDANGAYDMQKAEEVLNNLATLKVHSIEQPIKAGQWENMQKLCQSTPTPIALDEELIGVYPLNKKQELLETITPHYIILKPGLLGGFQSSDEWIELAEQNNTGWWATSALESNIGLNAISQWVFTKNVEMQQGLGTGMLFSNNIDSPLTLKGEKLFYNPSNKWGEIERG